MPETVDFVATRLSRVWRQLRHLPRALALVWAAARRWTILWLVLLLVQGVLPVALVYLTRSLVDSLVGAAGAVAAAEVGVSWETVQTPLLLALLMAALLLLTELLRALTRLVRTAQAELVQDHISGLIHERAAAVDLAYYDSPAYHDQLWRARIDAAQRPVALVENLGSLLQNGLTLAAMAAVLVPFGWWVPVALMASTAPAFWVVVRYAQRQHEWRMRTTEDQRRSGYYDAMLTLREAASELRLFALGDEFRRRFQDLRSGLRSERLRLARDEARAEVAAGTFAVGLLGAAIGWMVIRTIRGELSLGQLAMFYQAFAQGQKLMRALLETVGQLYSNVLFLENLFDFLAVERQVRDCPRPLPPPETIGQGIAFRGVVFRYPSSARPVLDGFDLEIPAGRVVALLGANGAGKSTLFKLLCRLYDPEAGSVSIDGTDIRQLSLTSLRRLITVLFQEPTRYSETVRRNIEFGDVGAEPDPERTERAVETAGAAAIIAGLPRGLETLLGTWFLGGAELSVGEWQRVALSRAFLRDASIVLLDEPTSAMDSWQEADWMRAFRRLARGRTAIIITHRLTTAMAADTIHVMEAGRIIESGSHDELLLAGGRYAAAWEGHRRLRPRRGGEGEG